MLEIFKRVKVLEIQMEKMAKSLELNHMKDQELSVFVSNVNKSLSDLKDGLEEAETAIAVNIWKTNISQHKPVYEPLTKTKMINAGELDLSEHELYEATVMRYTQNLMVGTVAGITGKFAIPTTWREIIWGDEPIKVLFSFVDRNTRASLILEEWEK